MRLPLNYWLETIADDTIRESAIEQWNKEVSHAVSLDNALDCFNDWADTRENHFYWDHLYYDALTKGLPLRPYTSPEGHTFNPDTGEWTMPAEDHLPIREDKTYPKAMSSEFRSIEGEKDALMYRDEVGQMPEKNDVMPWRNKTEVIEVSKCVDCPFHDLDMENGRWCNAAKEEIIDTKTFPDFCPLRSKQITVKIK